MRHYEENEVVRLLAPQQGEDPYTGDFVSLPLGEKGTVIVGGQGHDTYDVEFVRHDAAGDLLVDILTVKHSDLELVWSPPAQ